MAKSWPLADNLGSVRDIVDSTGAVENHITYDSFGNVTSETDDTVNHIYAYTGRDRDEESDLQYNRARYYDANVGRWISEDPIAFAAGDSNLARYVGNAATQKKDPSGKVAVSQTTQENITERSLPGGPTAPSLPAFPGVRSDDDWDDPNIYPNDRGTFKLQIAREQDWKGNPFTRMPRGKSLMAEQLELWTTVTPALIPVTVVLPTMGGVCLVA